MPKTKSYIDRVRVINSCLHNSKRFYTLEELTLRINNALDKRVSERTVEKDIMDMRSEGAPIKNEAGTGYIYAPNGYNHFEIKVLPAHLEKIKLAALLVKQIPGLDLHEELEDIFEDLQLKIEDEDKRQIIQFDTRPQYEGAKHMVDILEAIRGKSVISFDYQPFKYDSPKKVTVHPYLLKEYNNRWFLVGLNASSGRMESNSINQYALERIKSKIKYEKQKYFCPNNFNLDEYFAHVIGVSMPQGSIVDKVVLKFSLNRSKYIETNPLHQSQKLLKEKNSKSYKVFCYELVLNQELESVILSFGADVEVLQPKVLRKSIFEKIQRLTALYSIQCK